MTPTQASNEIGATHYTNMADGDTPQMYYKIDGGVVYYRTFADLWHKSARNNTSDPYDGLIEITEA